MEENYVVDSVEERLINAGLTELLHHGIADFSLRRVATAAGVSCAAPYRHFKDKDELIIGIIDYVLDGWILLSEEIRDIYIADLPSAIIELSVSLVRFFLGNGNFRSVLTVAMADSDPNRRRELSKFDSPIVETIGQLCADKLLTEEDGRVIAYTVLSLIYGTLMLVSRGVNSEACIENMRSKIIMELLGFL